MPRRAPPSIVNPRVACYARVSSDDQAERQTVGAQVDFLARYVDLHGLDCHDVYVDDGVSGTVPLDERPAGRRLVADAEAGRFGAVLVYRLDRLGRSLRALLAAHDRLMAAGVSIRSGTEPFDTSTPIGQFLFQLLGGLAELERSTIVERMSLGRDRVARGGTWTNGYVPYGYDLDADGRIVASARVLPHGRTEAETARDLFSWIAGGMTLIAACRKLEALGVPCVHRRPSRPDEVKPRWWATRVWKIIRHPIYRGEHVLKSRNGPVPIPAPALVAADVWEAAGAAMTRNRDLSRAPAAREYLLRGLVRCGTVLDDGTVCGRMYSGAPGSRGGARLYYHCSGARGRAVSTAPGRPRCIGRSIPMADLDADVWADVRAFVLDPGPPLAAARAALDRRPAADAGASERARLEAAIAERAAERERAQLLFRRGLADLDETERAITAADAGLAQVRALLAGLDADRAADAALDRHLSETELLIGSLIPLVAAGDAGDRAAMRRVMDLLVREVSIATTRVERTSRRQKRQPKRVDAIVRYRFAPAMPMSGSLLDASASGILPDIGTLAIDRELVLV